MDISAIIPAKANSSRVRNKNFRPFLDGMSLVDVLIDKLRRAGITNERIAISCDDPDVAGPVADRWQVRFVQRDKELCDNRCPFRDVFQGVLSDCARSGLAVHTGEILWAQCINPLFNEYRELFEHWEKHKRPSPDAPLQYDSCRVIHPHRGYRLDQNKMPVGWGYGTWHVPSQQLPLDYLVSFTASILTVDCIREHGYYWGRNVLDYESSFAMVDIDTEEDFRVASAYCRERK